MKAILLEKPQVFRSIELGEPSAPGPGQALVRIHRIGICGTDYGGFLGKMPFYSYPRVPGHELGVEVILVTRGDKMLRSYDQEIVSKLVDMSREKGIDIRMNFPLKSVTKLDSGCLQIDGGEQGLIETDMLLWAIGRVPNTSNLGLETAGVAVGEHGEVLVGSDNRTNIPSVYAVGDVTNRVQLTPVAIREGHAFADSVFGGNGNDTNANETNASVSNR